MLRAVVLPSPSPWYRRIQCQALTYLNCQQRSQSLHHPLCRNFASATTTPLRHSSSRTPHIVTHSTSLPTPILPLSTSASDSNSLTEEEYQPLPFFSEQRSGSAEPSHHHHNTQSTNIIEYEAPVELPLHRIFGKFSINWYPGHMHAAKQALAERVSKCHLVLEVRDARIPFSSGNPDFNSLLSSKKRIIIFNKCDLADSRSFPAVKQYFKERNQPVIFMAGDPVVVKKKREGSMNGGRKKTENDDENESAVDFDQEDSETKKAERSHHVNRAQLRELHALIQTNLGKRRFTTVPPVLLVVGFPNTGKSTIINAFRSFSKVAAGRNAGKSFTDKTKEETQKMQKGGIAKVGPTPGVTRGISGFLVSSVNTSSATSAETDKLFLLDTPGIMLPYIPTTPQGIELGLKLSSINSIADLVVGEEAIVRFTLWILNRAKKWEYVEHLKPYLKQPTNDLSALLLAIYHAKIRRMQGGKSSQLFKQFLKLRKEVRESNVEDEEEGNDENGEENEEITTEGVTEQEETNDHPERVAPHLLSAAAAASTTTALTPSSTSTFTSPRPSTTSSPPNRVIHLTDLTSEELQLCTSWWIKAFRRGEFGKLTIDYVPPQQQVENRTRQRRGGSSDERKERG